MKVAKMLFAVLVAMICQSALADCPGGTMSTGWCWPTGAGTWTSYGQWHAYNTDFPSQGNHLAKDIDADEDDSVYAMGYGVVLITRTDVGNYGGATCDGKSVTGAGIVIRHYTSSGNAVDVLYAHLKNLLVQRGSVVAPGTVIGKIRNYTWCNDRKDHLHLGVVYPARNLVAYDKGGTGDVWAGYGTTDRGFVNPVDFFEATSNTAGSKIYGCNPSKERCLLRISGSIGWYPPVDDCQQATQWYNMATVNSEKTAVGSTTKSACPLACFAN